MKKASNKANDVRKQIAHVDMVELEAPFQAMATMTDGIDRILNTDAAIVAIWKIRIQLAIRQIFGIDQAVEGAKVLRRTLAAVQALAREWCGAKDSKRQLGSLTAAINRFIDDTCDHQLYLLQKRVINCDFEELIWNELQDTAEQHGNENLEIAQEVEQDVLGYPTNLELMPQPKKPRTRTPRPGRVNKKKTSKNTAPATTTRTLRSRTVAVQNAVNQAASRQSSTFTTNVASSNGHLAQPSSVPLPIQPAASNTVTNSAQVLPTVPVSASQSSTSANGSALIPAQPANATFNVPVSNFNGSSSQSLVQSRVASSSSRAASSTQAPPTVPLSISSVPPSTVSDVAVSTRPLNATFTVNSSPINNMTQTLSSAQGRSTPVFTSSPVVTQNASLASVRGTPVPMGSSTPIGGAGSANSSSRGSDYAPAGTPSMLSNRTFLVVRGTGAQVAQPTIGPDATSSPIVPSNRKRGADSAQEIEAKRSAIGNRTFSISERDALIQPEGYRFVTPPSQVTSGIANTSEGANSSSIFGSYRSFHPANNTSSTGSASPVLNGTYVVGGRPANTSPLVTSDNSAGRTVNVSTRGQRTYTVPRIGPSSQQPDVPSMASLARTEAQNRTASSSHVIPDSSRSTGTSVVSHRNPSSGSQASSNVPSRGRRYDSQDDTMEL